MREMMLAPDRDAKAERNRSRLADQLRAQLDMPDEETRPGFWSRHRPRFTRRDVFLFWVPLLLVCGLGIGTAYWTELRDVTMDTAEDVRKAVLDHPEFAVRKVEITGRKETPRDFVLAALKMDSGEPSVSSLEFDVAAARERLIRSRWIEDASVALDPTGTVRLRLEERDPVAIWRAGGKYWLIDAEGQPVSTVDDAGERLDLPYLLGKGANDAVADARALLLSVPPEVAEEILALVRRGERRWDMVSKYGFVIKLPQEGALDSLRQYGASQLGPRLKPLAVLAIDLRRPEEPPVLRLEPGTNDLRLEALATLRKPDPK